MNIHSKASSPYPDIAPLIIAVSGIIKQLQNLNPNIAAGPDKFLHASLKKKLKSQLK